jgi:hypothetical protein
MRLLVPAYFVCLHFTGTDSPHALTFAVCGVLCGFLALARAAYLFTHPEARP